jgi:hypothetical protein
MIGSSPRAACLVLVTLGLLIGTFADRTLRRNPLRAGDYWVLSGDVHVHAFPGDGALSPWMLRDEAARAGLDVIGVTNHNQLFTGRLARWIAQRTGGPLMIAGQEVTNRDYHLVALGLTRVVDAEQPAARVIAEIHAQGGVAIAAHPSRRFHGYDSDEAVTMLDGTEACHPDVDRDPEFRAALTAFHHRAQYLNANVAAIGSSDFHAMPPVMGRCRTYLFVRERNEAGVLEAIRRGRTLAVDGEGNMQGDPALITLMGSARPVGRSNENGSWQRASTIFAWLGTLGIVLFRRQSDP